MAFDGPGLSLGLASPVPVTPDRNGIAAELALHEGQKAVLVLRQIPPGSSCGPARSEQEGAADFVRTINCWRGWISRCSYTGRLREVVHRAAPVLKLLTYAPTGAIVAAATCSLPEAVGGSRNWDYPYSWIRDAAFTLHGLLRIGLTEEGARFMDWSKRGATSWILTDRYRSCTRIHERHALTEEMLDHLDGYKGSRPVRIGNAAYQQLQLDTCGELMDSVYLYNKYGNAISMSSGPI